MTCPSSIHLLIVVSAAFSVVSIFLDGVSAASSSVAPYGGSSSYQQNLTCYNCYELAPWNRSYCQKPMLEVCRDTYPGVPCVCLQVFQWFDPQSGIKNTILEQCQPRYAVPPEGFGRCQVQYRREIDGTLTLVGMCSCFDSLCNNRQFFENRNRSSSSSTSTSIGKHSKSIIHSTPAEPETSAGETATADEVGSASTVVGFPSNDQQAPEAMSAIASSSAAAHVPSLHCDCMFGGAAVMLLQAVSTISGDWLGQVINW